MLKTLAGHDYLLEWYYTRQDLKLCGTGCEASVYVDKDVSPKIKVKHFVRFSEFRRYIIGSIALNHALKELHWQHHIQIPSIFGVDIDKLAVIAQFIPYHQSIDKQALIGRTKAVTALVCAAGIVSEYSENMIAQFCNSMTTLKIPACDTFWLGGVDANPNNLIYDGYKWWAIDF